MCTECQPNEIVNSEGECEQCPADEIPMIDEDTCMKCPPDKISDDGSMCEACGAGTILSDDKTQCEGMMCYYKIIFESG